VEPTDLAFAGLVRQAGLVRDGSVSPRELVELSLERIARLDPELNAFRVVLAEQARAEAAAAERDDGVADQPLRGVPVAVKDDLDVGGEVTAFGTGAYGPPAREDSEVVRRLRAAGAIVIGKTNVPELTQWPFTESITWGRTRNPWDLERTPGGSSGGSAAAVAAGLVPAALGTDGLGSVRIPAACCGLVGVKPQRGRVSYAPLAEHWHGLSVIGPLARRAADAALLLDVMAAERPARGFVEAARPPERPLRIALSAKTPLPGPVAREVRAALEETATLLRSLGHRVEERDPAYGTAIFDAAARYLRGIHDDAAEVPRPHRLERRTRAMARAGGLVPARLMGRLRSAEPAVAAKLGALFGEFDVLMTPSLAQLPLPVGRFEGRGAALTFNGAAQFIPYTGPWNLSGHPAAAVPAGFTPEGLPLSVQLVGRPHEEATLLSLAAQQEAERGWPDRRPPFATA